MGEEKQKGVLRGLPDVDLYSCGMRSLTDLVEFFALQKRALRNIPQSAFSNFCSRLNDAADQAHFSVQETDGTCGKRLSPEASDEARQCRFLFFGFDPSSLPLCRFRERRLQNG